MGLVNYIQRQNELALARNNNIVEDTLTWEPTPALRYKVKSHIKRIGGFFGHYEIEEEKTLQQLWEARASDSAKTILRSEWRDVPEDLQV